MECDELMAMLTIGAVAPYVAEAAITWIRRSGKHFCGASALLWFKRSKPKTANLTTKC